MVGFPYRTDRLLDELACRCATIGSSGDEIPKTGAEVRPGKQRVERDAAEHRRRDDIGQIHVPLSDKGTRASRRNTANVADASTMYTAINKKYP